MIDKEKQNLVKKTLTDFLRSMARLGDNEEPSQDLVDGAIKFINKQDMDGVSDIDGFIETYAIAFVEPKIKSGEL